jgi:hypothetical protein
LEKYQRGEFEVFILDHHPDSENDFKAPLPNTAIVECGAASSVITHELSKQVKNRNSD